MYSYGVGQVIDKFIGHAEGVAFDLSDDAGAFLLVFFNGPTEEEIEQFHTDHPFEIRYTDFKDLIVITTKIGNLNWMDAPYNSHLSRELNRFTMPEEGEGLALQVLLVDSATGTIKHIRLMGLSNHFSRKLISAAQKQRERPFDRQEHDQAVDSIFKLYNTKAIAERSAAYCKINA